MLPIETVGYLFFFGFAGLEAVNVAVIIGVFVWVNQRLGDMRNAHDEDMLRMHSELSATNRAFAELAAKFTNKPGDNNISIGVESNAQSPKSSYYTPPK